MPIPRRKSHFGGLRLLLFVAVVAIVGGVGGLLYFGSAGKSPRRKPAAGEISQAEKGTTLLGQDFDYTYTQGEKQVFRIRAESIRADKENTLFLVGVGITLFDPQQRVYEMESREGNFKRSTNEGELRGQVKLRGPGDLQLRTDALDLLEQGRVLVSERPAEISFLNRYLGWGQELKVTIPEQLFVLAGKTSVQTLPEVKPPLSLNADRLVYERQQRQVRVEGQAGLTRGEDSIHADRITAFLNAEETALLFVRALGAVHGESHSQTAAQGKTVLRFKGEDLAVLMEPTGTAAGREPRTLSLEGIEGQKAELETTGGGLNRLLLARRVEGHMAAGVLTAAEGFGGVSLRETGADGTTVLRRAEGQRAQAGFRADGQISTLALQSNVTYSDPKLTVVGDRAQMNFDSGQGEFFGKPVYADSERGQFTGPHLTYDRSTGILHADNGVQALLLEQGGALGESPLAQGEGPVHIDAKEAFLRDKPRSFLFKGDVRAWRGESLLTAKELRGDVVVPGAGAGAPPEDRLVGTGGVKTFWIPRPESPAAAGAAKGANPANPTDTANPQKPIEVTAAELTYLQGKGLITYTGDVRVVQEGKTLTCQQLEVQIGKDKKAETLTCTGQAHLIDPQAGRDLQGDRALYKLKERVIDMYGQPVRLKDKDNNRLQGKHMTYSMDSGKVEVRGDPAAPKPAATPGAAAKPPGGAGR